MSKMTFLGICRAEDPNEEMDSSDSSVWREVEFESDVDHKEMTRTYGCDDYLSRWLPNIKQKDEAALPWKEKNEKRSEKEHPNRLFKSPCHNHEGQALRDNKIQREPTKKTYFEAIKCSPMKLRQSLANYKRPKLEQNFTSKANHDAKLNHKPLNTPGTTENTADPTTSMESMEDAIEPTLTTKNPLIAATTLGKPSEVIKVKPRTGLGVVEMKNDEMGQLGSLCLCKSLPVNFYGGSLYTPCNMIGGKLRKVHRGTNRDSALLTGRNKSKELLVRCESIMIYPKVLVNQKEQGDKLVTNSKQELEKHVADCHDVVTNIPKTSTAKPKEAWNDLNASEKQQTVLSKTSESKCIQLPQLNIKDQSIQRRNEQNTSSETQLDTPNGKPVLETYAVENCKDKQPPTEVRTPKNSASTKIIIPFGEDELVNQTTEKNRSKSEYVRGERDTPVKIKSSVKETPTLQKVQRAYKTGLPKEEGVEKSLGKAGKSNEWNGSALLKSRYLKESSKLNEESNSTRRHSDVALHLRDAGLTRKLVITTQYQILNTANSPLKKFRIPTGVEKNEVFIGRENYPPKNKTSPFRLAYNQREVSECSKSFHAGVTQQDNGGQRGSLKIGGKGLLKLRLSRDEKKLPEGESKKRVQFLVNNSRYFT